MRERTRERRLDYSSGSARKGTRGNDTYTHGEKEEEEEEEEETFLHEDLREKVGEGEEGGDAT